MSLCTCEHQKEDLQSISLSFNITQIQWGNRKNQKSSVEGFSECGVECVYVCECVCECVCVIDAVEGQRAGRHVHIYSYSIREWTVSRYIIDVIIVIDSESGTRAPQTPGFVI